ncbi:MAG: ribonuclease III [bacterium]|nr:ribonuclease III [bacterium]
MIFRSAKRLIKSLSYDHKDRELSTAYRNIIGVAPVNLHLYKLAMRHSSVAETKQNGFKESNERLEYLGDAILGAVVAEYLFARFPYKEEGFLTEIRSRIVNREVLNELAKKIGLRKLVEFNKAARTNLSHKSLYGDSLEALIGAVYLDLGFKRCRKFVLDKLIGNHYDIEQIIENNTNFKSMIIEWAQKESKEIKFEIIDISGESRYKQFTAQISIDDKPIGIGHGLSKKKAEQDAAQKSCEILEII